MIEKMIEYVGWFILAALVGAFIYILWGSHRRVVEAEVIEARLREIEATDEADVPVSNEVEDKEDQLKKALDKEHRGFWY